MLRAMWMVWASLDLLREASLLPTFRRTEEALLGWRVPSLFGLRPAPRRRKESGRLVRKYR
jgi:hypothetical protein